MLGWGSGVVAVAIIIVSSFSKRDVLNFKRWTVVDSGGQSGIFKEVSETGESVKASGQFSKKSIKDSYISDTRKKGYTPL